MRLAQAIVDFLLEADPDEIDPKELAFSTVNTDWYWNALKSMAPSSSAGIKSHREQLHFGPYTVGTSSHPGWVFARLPNSGLTSAIKTSEPARYWGAAQNLYRIEDVYRFLLNNRDFWKTPQ